MENMRDFKCDKCKTHFRCAKAAPRCASCGKPAKPVDKPNEKNGLKKVHPVEQRLEYYLG